MAFPLLMSVRMEFSNFKLLVVFERATFVPIIPLIWDLFVMVKF